MAGFCATPIRRIPVLCGTVVHVLRCNTRYFIDNRRYENDGLGRIGVSGQTSRYCCPMASPLLCNQSLNLVSPVGPLSEVSSPAISPSTSPGSAPRRAAAVRPDGSGLSSGTQAYALTGRAAHRRGQQAKQVFTGERFRPGGIGDDVLTLTAAGGLSLLLFRPQPLGESLPGYGLCHPGGVGLGQLHRLLDV